MRTGAERINPYIIKMTETELSKATIAKLRFN